MSQQADVVFIADEEDEADLQEVFQSIKKHGLTGRRVHPREIFFSFDRGCLSIEVSGSPLSARLVVGWLFEDWLAPGIAILETIERAGFPVVNPGHILFAGQNKALMSALLHAEGVPHGHVVVSFDSDGSRTHFRELRRPYVVKPGFVHAGGRTVRTSGFGVARLTTAESLDAVHETLSNLGQPLYMQEYVERPRNRDIRVWLLGYDPVAAVYKEPKSGEWITNTRRGVSISPCPLSPELIEISQRAAKAIGAEIAGLDVAEKMDGGFVVLEVNTCPTFGPARSLFGDMIPDAYANFLAKRLADLENGKYKGIDT